MVASAGAIRGKNAKTRANEPWQVCHQRTRRQALLLDYSTAILTSKLATKYRIVWVAWRQISCGPVSLSIKSPIRA